MARLPEGRKIRETRVETRRKTKRERERERERGQRDTLKLATLVVRRMKRADPLAQFLAYTFDS